MKGEWPEEEIKPGEIVLVGCTKDSAIKPGEIFVARCTMGTEGTTRRAEGDISLDDIRSLIWSAVKGKSEDAYLTEVYPSYLIYELEGKYFKVGYSILDGEAKLGSDEIQVENTWVETRSQQAETDEDFETRLSLDAPQDTEGAVWDVTICEPGFTKNGWYLADDVLRSAEGLFEGVDVCMYQLPNGFATHVPDTLYEVKKYLTKNKVGGLGNVRFVAGKGLKAVLTFLDSAKWLGRNLMDYMNKTGKPPYGLSYDCPVRAKKDVVKGKTVFKALKFLSADSVDIVSRPAAGGKFERALASRQGLETEEIMDKEQLWKLISEKRPDLLNGKTLESIGDEELVGLARMAMEPPAAEPAGGTGGGDDDDPAANKPDNNMATKDDLALMRCEMALDKELAGSGLPEKAQDRVRMMFKDRVFEDDELTRAIADEKDYLASLNPNAGDSLDVGDQTRIQAGLGTVERAQMAIDRMFGLTQEDIKEMRGMQRLDHKPFFHDLRSNMDIGEYDAVPAFSSLGEMYYFFTGDSEVRGNFNRKLCPALRSGMGISSSTFSYVLGNTLARRLVKDYMAVDFREDLLISTRKPAKDFRSQEAVMVGYFGDIADVDPETEDYSEIDAVTDEEATYSVTTRGNLLTVTRKTIINDDISVINKLVSRLGRAARRTHAKFVWNFFINNSNCSDGTAWFTSGHGNLGATALSFATALVGYKALASMTEKDSGEIIGLLDDPSLKPVLVYPVDLLETAESIVEEEFYYATNDLTDKTRNSLKGKIQGAQISLLTDANDWGMLMPPQAVDMIEMGYLFGRQEPEMFVADQPSSEQVLVADKVRYKIRHEYSGTPVDFRSGYKAVVA